MARVRLLMQMSGPRPDGTVWPGYKEVLDCGDDEAAFLLNAGIAEPAEDEATPEPPALPEPPAGDPVPAKPRAAQTRTASSKPRI